MGAVKKIIAGTILLAGAAAVASSLYARSEAENKEPGHRYVTKEEAAEVLGRPFAEPSKMLEGVVKKATACMKIRRSSRSSIRKKRPISALFCGSRIPLPRKT